MHLFFHGVFLSAAGCEGERRGLDGGERDEEVTASWSSHVSLRSHLNIEDCLMLLQVAPRTSRAKGEIEAVVALFKILDSA